MGGRREPRLSAHRDVSWRHPSDEGDRPRLSVPLSKGGAVRLLLGLVLTAVLALFFAAYNVEQVTAEGAATGILERAIAHLSEIDALLADVEDDMREAAASGEGAGVTVPDFPMEVTLDAGQLQRSSHEELRALILDRAAARSYAEGAPAFGEGGAPGLDRLSAPGLVRAGFDFLQDSTHTLALLALALTGAAALGLALLLLRVTSGAGRLIALGLCILGAAGPSLGVVLGVRAALGSAADDSGADPITSQLAKLAQDVAGVFVVNYVAITAAGAVILGLGVVYLLRAGRGRASQRGPAREPAR